MTLSLFEAAIIGSDGAALWRGLSPEIASEPDALGHGLFLRATAKLSSSRLLFGLGSLERFERFSACHRYEPYWMKPRAGTRLSDVPPETQSLLVRFGSERWLLVVPLVDSLFRFSLRGKADDSLVLVAESGDAFTPGHGGLALYIACGRDPFELLRAGAESVSHTLGIGKLRRDKALPAFVDQFGWCTWDAFYQEVSATNVRQGLTSFRAGGVEPRFLILDDGWQSVARRDTGEIRLTAFAANDKFPGGLAALVKCAKNDYAIETFLVWHAVVGYWGGVDGSALGKYAVVDQTRQFCEGVLQHEPTFNQDWWGNLFGLVPGSHIEAFYDDYHRALAAEGVDGVKVDSQAVLEAVAQRQGGRVPLALAYRRALESSVERNFQGRLINCMSNQQESFYYAASSSLLRSSIDFFPTRPESHGAHLYANAQVGAWFGEFMQLDWDMFQSAHEWGTYHAAARAISGGPVYVSDKPGAHDFALLKKLVCSDGTVLRCAAPARPTADVLCHDPTREDVLLKIWNWCGGAGVIGVFNARAGHAGQAAPALSGQLTPTDVPGLVGESFACYLHNQKKLKQLGRGNKIGLTLGEREFELCTLVPIERGFAAIGLADKFNSHAAVERLEWRDAGHCELSLREGGLFVAYAERAPSRIELDGRAIGFDYDASERCVSLTLTQSGKQRLSISF
ncbi:MAG: Sip1-related alpha-galactosidase [Myxococcota bacterium]